MLAAACSRRPHISASSTNLCPVPWLPGNITVLSVIAFSDAALRLQTLNSVVRDCSCMHHIYLPAVSFTDLFAVSLAGQLQLVLSVDYRLIFPCLQLHALMPHVFVSSCLQSPVSLLFLFQYLLPVLLVGNS